MEGVLRQRIVAALDEERELESERNRAESEKRFEKERRDEEQYRMRILTALERISSAFDRMSECLMHISTRLPIR